MTSKVFLETMNILFIIILKRRRNDLLCIFGRNMDPLLI